MKDAQELKPFYETEIQSKLCVGVGAGAITIRPAERLPKPRARRAGAVKNGKRG